MLAITVLGAEQFNEETQEFFTKDDVVLNLEHSLVSLSKWEAIWEVPFLTKDERTPEQLYSYVECMCLHPVSSPDVFFRLSPENLEEINRYLDSKQSATTITDINKGGPSREVITSELIYYWMVAFNIPFECEAWHLNRLFSLIKICNIKNSKPQKMSRSEMAQRNLNRLFNLIRIIGIKNTKPKKMSPSEMAARNRELNAQRRQQMGTRG